VIALCRDIVGRWPIPPEHVLAHSDIAPSRKQDPGEIFPWQRLAAEGVGLWVKPAPVDGTHAELPEDERTAFLHALSSFGYGVTLDQPGEVQAAVAAFQRHFRPSRVDGVIDPSSATTLRRLLMARSQNSNGFASN
jgi:N-acetylmuramoyl-L-alanine amidase